MPLTASVVTMVVLSSLTGSLLEVGKSYVVLGATRTTISRFVRQLGVERRKALRSKTKQHRKYRV
jgi:hypothetical protein